jgi:adenosylmethionine-8-amino-7-oxononanoate aminotransferase
MGNPLACAAANASLDLFEKEPRPEQVRSVSIQMSAELEPIKAFDCVFEVRVLGAIGVIEFYPDKMPNLTQLQQALIEAGVWLRPFGHILYVTPAFTMAPLELSRVTRAIVQVLSSV